MLLSRLINRFSLIKVQLAAGIGKHGIKGFVFKVAFVPLCGRKIYFVQRLISWAFVPAGSGNVLFHPDLGPVTIRRCLHNINSDTSCGSLFLIGNGKRRPCGFKRRDMHVDVDAIRISCRGQKGLSAFDILRAGHVGTVLVVGFNRCIACNYALSA